MLSRVLEPCFKKRSLTTIPKKCTKNFADATSHRVSLRQLETQQFHKCLWTGGSGCFDY